MFFWISKVRSPFEDRFWKSRHSVKYSPSGYAR